MRRGLRDCRYYPNDSELQYLISKIKAYFDYQERSVQRNQLAASVADHLKRQNPHWTHRAVRLWFNNNRHNYLLPETSNLNQKNQNEPQHRKFNHQSNSTTPSSEPTNGSTEDLKGSKQAEELGTLFLTVYNSNLPSLALKKELDRIQLICQQYDIDPMSFLREKLIILPSFVKHQISIPNLLNPPNHPRAPSPSLVSGFWLHPDFNQDISIHLENNFISYISNKTSTFITQVPPEAVEESSINQILSFKQTFSLDNWANINFQSDLPLKSIFSFGNFIWFTNGIDIYLYQCHLTQNNLITKQINLFPTQINTLLNQNLNPNTIDHINQNININININYFEENKILFTKNIFNPILIQYDQVLNELTECSIEFTPEKVFTATETFDNNFLFSYKNSNISKMIDVSNGLEKRAFVGHTHDVSKLKTINNLLFSAETGSILMWDVREPKPVMGIPLPPSLQVSCFSCLDSDFNTHSILNRMAFALNDEKIRFIDIRNSTSVNGIVTTMGRMESFASNDDGSKLSLFTSHQNAYWECQNNPLFVN